MAKKRRGWGEGSIEELPSGKFRAIVPSGRDPETGKRCRLTATFDSKKEAIAWRNEQLEIARRSGGGPINPGKVTVGEWLDQWLALRAPKIQPKTYDHDEKRIRLLLKPHLGQQSLAKLTALEIEQALATMALAGVSTSERHKAGSVLRAALKGAVRARLIHHNVARDVVLPKVDRPEKTSLEVGQAVALLAAASSHRLGAWFDVALDTGARPGELRALHWPDVDLDGGTIYIHQSLEELKGRLRIKKTKTRKGVRRLRVAPRTVLALRGFREAMKAEGRDILAGPVFCDTEGGLLRESNFQRRVFLPILAASGVPRIRPYDLRHTCATLLLQAGVNIRVVSDRLGHESIELTLRHYAHVLPSMQEVAAEVIERLFTLPDAA